MSLKEKVIGVHKIIGGGCMTHDCAAETCMGMEINELWTALGVARYALIRVKDWWDSRLPNEGGTEIPEIKKTIEAAFSSTKVDLADKLRETEKQLHERQVHCSEMLDAIHELKGKNLELTQRNEGDIELVAKLRAVVEPLHKWASQGITHWTLLSSEVFEALAAAIPCKQCGCKSSCSFSCPCSDLRGCSRCKCFWGG